MFQLSGSPLPRVLVVLTLCLARVAAQGLSVTDYAPSTGVTCPQTSLLRVFSAQNQSLNPSEIDFIQGRERVTLEAWNTWIGNGSTLGYNMSFSSDNAPRVGVALSGGGFRASLYGAGVLNSLDARNASAKQAGTGGLLQVASYLAGLSGKHYTYRWRRLFTGYNRRILAHIFAVLKRFPHHTGYGFWEWK